MALDKEATCSKQDPSRASITRIRGAKPGPSKSQVALLCVAACVVLFIFHHVSLGKAESRFDADDVEVPTAPSTPEAYLAIHEGHREKVRRKKAHWKDLSEEKKDVKEQKKLLWEEKRAMRQENRLLKQEESLLKKQQRKGAHEPEVAKQLADTKERLEEVKKRAAGLHEKEQQQEQKFEMLERGILGDGIGPGRKLLQGHDKVLKMHDENERKAKHLEQKHTENALHEDKLNEQYHKGKVR
mmetsp:Transcript_18705/g.33818  ORF Transcript_18705/g.33818 Transcript_18705/m.33818 type:complete len:242 (-) Transcript_18705:94-819(-)